MNIFRRIVFGAVVSAALSSAAQAQWVRKTQPAFGFSALYPAPPKTEASVEGGIKLNVNLAIDRGSGVMCIAGLGDYPAPVIPDVELPASRDSFLKNVKAVVSTQKRILFRRGATRLQGLEFDGVGDIYRYRSIIVIEGKRVYQVMGGVRKDGGKDADLERCVRGFTLIAKRPAGR